LFSRPVHLKLPALAAAGFALCLAAMPGPVRQISAQPPAFTLLSREDRRPLQVSISNGQEFVALDDLASAFQLVVRDEASGVVTVSYKGKTIILRPDQALASVAGKLISLPAAPTRSGRRWLVPVDFISQALAPIYDVRLDVRKASRLVVIGDLRVPRLSIRTEVSGPTTARLVIDADPRTASTVSNAGGRLTVKFDADALDVFLPPSPPQTPGGMIERIHLADPVTLAIDLGPRFASFHASTLPVESGSRLQIDLSSQPDTAASPSQPAGAPGAAAPPGAGPPPELVPPAGSAPSLRTVVIDPGHGGEDEGAIGAGGTKEKDVTLALGKRLRTALESRLGVRALLTRDDDRLVSLDQRASLANNDKSDLFISLHANTTRRKETAGVSVGLARFDSESIPDSPRAPGEQVPALGGSRSIELVSWDTAQIRYTEQSARLADILLEQFHDRVSIAPRPIERASFRVLESANMPAVIVEIGYLSNPKQERQLGDAAYQGTLVQAIVDAVVRFRSLDQDHPASPARVGAQGGQP
jgi:N-acetylmuramoyl-L-alanine amidase